MLLVILSLADSHMTHSIERVLNWIIVAFVE